MKKNVVILGGSGYVGQHLIETWLRKDNEINIISFSRSGKPKKLSSYLIDNTKVTWYAVDLFDYNSFKDLIPKDCFAIINLVGTATEKDKDKFIKINTEPVHIMLNILKDTNAKQGCYISGLMGMPGKNNIFIESKTKAESLIKNSKMNIEIIRPSLIYGDRPEVILMVPILKFMGLFSKKYKPINIVDLTNNIISIFNK